MNDYLIDEVISLWEHHKSKGYIQCTVTNIEGTVIYSFSGNACSKYSVGLCEEYLQDKFEVEEVLADISQFYTAKS